MSVRTALRSGDVYDANRDFVYAVSLLAALEGATGQDGHAVVLPFVGIGSCRSHRLRAATSRRLHPVHVGDLRAGLADLEDRLTALLANSQVLQHSLRLDSARRLRRGVAAVA